MKEIKFTILYCVCENFCYSISYGSGSRTVINYGSGSGSATLQLGISVIVNYGFGSAKVRY
jgi:hypothetical protein